ncbi:ester cyclase [Dyella sp. BiH032]|uniref:ester cyclase n=1 Tax=Dyella sp. BiH032 TaxID=3075430 RepID=UPI0028931CF6|nr:ester cyclase [Dyella sp. BiH032]WNL45849.1 ester cyclase [Dyella sp. BiH032]
MSISVRAASAAVLLSLAAGAHAESPLLQPRSLIVDGSVPKTQAEAQILAARRYDTFWSTGEEALAKAALASGFIDRTLPPGRAQGPEGPLAVSKLMRAAVPDLRCEVEQMLVVGDRVVTHLRFRGHFTGRFKDTQGQGQAIDFIATDIYRIADGRITDNWHLEDNLTLLGQMGLVRTGSAPSPEKKS